MSEIETNFPEISDHGYFSHYSKLLYCEVHYLGLSTPYLKDTLVAICSQVFGYAFHRIDGDNFFVET